MGNSIWLSAISSSAFQPSSRASHALALLPTSYDPAQQNWRSNASFVLFGGMTASGASNETWLLQYSNSAITWSRLELATRPRARFGFAFHPVGLFIALFGGACPDSAAAWALCDGDELLWLFDSRSLQWLQVGESS